LGAVAFYAGLRSGELQGFAWESVDLAGGTIRVERAWDPKSRQFVAPKSRAGVRRVPLIPRFRELLLDRKLASDGSELVWTSRAGMPIKTAVLRSQALTAWRDSGFEPITLHECRHTYAPPCRVCTNATARICGSSGE
jgi:integrase